MDTEFKQTECSRRHYLNVIRQRLDMSDVRTNKRCGKHLWYTPCLWTVSTMDRKRRWLCKVVWRKNLKLRLEDFD